MRVDGVREMTSRVIGRLAALGALPEDDADLQARKGAMILSTVLITALSFVWVITYFAVSLPLSAAIPLTYQIVSIVGLVYVFRTKRFRPYLFSQFLMMLILPFLLQATLGGFVNGSVVSLWALFTPLAALVFLGPDGSVPWFVGYAALLLVAGVFDAQLQAHAPDVPEALRRAFFVLDMFGVGLSAYLILRYFVRQRELAAAALAVEREKSERLLLNVLPVPIAARLKEHEGVIADRFDDVSVLFADIVGFTELAQAMDPAQLVEMLNGIFTAFDHLAERESLEKIKTIGDSYMIAGGLPQPLADHPRAIARMALGMQEELRNIAQEHTADLQLRIGIDIGPVVAGVIGRNKFIYDLWGDTVNTASRMESHGLPGEIQVTRRAYERMCDDFDLVTRGPLQVKGKGIMDTFLLQGISRPA